jgi:hydroxyacylglutathione hydrolase
MEFVPFYLACLAHGSYLIGDHSTGTALVVDPQRDIAPYLATAAERGLTIRHVVLTHFHADFVAGHLALHAATGATVHLGAAAQAEFAFAPLTDGAEIVLGDTVRVRALATPGHTLEGISLLVVEHGVVTRALTGDTLFVGDVGRPDLLASVGVSATDLATALHASLQRLLALPDTVEVWPAHGAGSLCGKKLGAERFSTIGAERRANWALQPMPPADFIAQVTADQPAAPAYFIHDVQLNRSGDSGRLVTSTALSAAAFRAAQAQGALVLDVRDGAAFAAAHIPGAIAIGLSGAFAPTVGQVVAPTTRLLVVAEPGREAEAATRLGRIGYDGLVGHLEGGMAAWGDAPVAAATRMTAAEVRAAGSALIIDVRTPGERAQGAIPGSLGIPLIDLPTRLADLPRDRLLIVHCAGGYRSLAAGSLLARAGFTVADLLGGYQAYRTSV